MKALALTILTIIASLIVANLLSGMNYTPSRQSAAVPAQATSSVPYTAISSGSDTTAGGVVAPLPMVTVDPAATDAATYAEPVATVDHPPAAGDVARQNGGIATAVAAASIEKARLNNLPVSYGDVDAPVAVDSAPAVAVAEDAPRVAESTLGDGSSLASILAGPAADPAPAEPTAAVATPSVSYHSPELDSFTAVMKNGQASQVVGVFVQGKFALPVLQQPEGDVNYVAVQDNTVTQFATPYAYGTIGLLAHNFLSGKLFFNLKENDDVFIVYGDGLQEDYRITQIQRYQALNPSNPYSYFVDPNDPANTSMTAGELFDRIYAHPGRVVLQTCIDANGDPSWGRLFVTATKVQ